MPPRRVAKPKPAHPGVLAAHDGRVAEEECAHPAARRDGKNPARCCACGTVGLTAPAAKPPKGRGRR